MATQQTPTLQIQLSQSGPIPLDVSMCAEAGKLTALVGPSGSGKTTILRSIAGLYRPRDGQINIGERVLFDAGENHFVPPQKRRTGIVFQNYALFPHMTAMENVEVALLNQSESMRANKAQSLLKRVHLDGLGDRRPAQLSGGEQQRVALARALAGDPELLLLDEPFSAVDTVTRRKLRLELSTLIRDLDIPIIMVTHDLDEACMLARSVCVIHAGTTLQQGPPEELIRHPVSSLVARLLDTRNIFQAKIHSTEENATTQILWADRLLTVPWQPTHTPNAPVEWCIRPTDILLIPKDRPFRRSPDNVQSARVNAVLASAGMTQVALTLYDDPAITLHMDLPPHVGTRHNLTIGDEISISLPAELIHLML